jgi:hypothetical protein
MAYEKGRVDMGEVEKRKGGGSKLTRSETVTVRLDPKLRYLADLAARLHRRTISSFIEWAIEEVLKEEAVRPKGMPGLVIGNHTLSSEGDYLWDVEEPDRLAKLAMKYPHLLTHEEQRWWKVVMEEPRFWAGDGTDEKSLQLKKLRKSWEDVKRYAMGEITEEDFVESISS